MDHHLIVGFSPRSSRVTGELTAHVGARVMEQFTVLEGALSILRFGGRDGIRTRGLLIANGESLKLRRVATIS